MAAQYYMSVNDFETMADPAHAGTSSTAAKTNGSGGSSEAKTQPTSTPAKSKYADVV